MFIDNLSTGVKFGRTLRNGNALLVIAKKNEAEGDRRGIGKENRGSNRCGKRDW